MHDGHGSTNQTANEHGGRTRWQRFAGWCRRRAVLLIPAALVIYGGVLLAQPPSVADLSRKSAESVPALLSAWQEGHVIVVLRHLERCDRADSPCLDGQEKGVTERAVAGGRELGKRFDRLGLANADILNSPLARTAQTAQIVFNRAEYDQGWLNGCRKQMLDSMMQRKVSGRNLILVTHSGCMEALQRELGFGDAMPDYGRALFISAQPASTRPLMLGFLDMDDWDSTLGF